MRSFVIFSVLDQNYGIDIESVKRILPAQELTEIPDEGAHIEGMFQYEEDVIKVISFRKAIGKKSYEEQLKQMFPGLESQHKEWVNALKESVETGEAFTKTTDPHACHLGKWIDSFHPDNEELLVLMKKLSSHHQSLHMSAVEVLQMRKTSVDEAKQLIEENTDEFYKNTLNCLQKVSEHSSIVAAELQRCLIVRDDKDEFFGLNIDAVEDIVHIEESELHEVQEVQHMGDFMNVAAILTHNKKLVTIIKDISLEKRSA